MTSRRNRRLLHLACSVAFLIASAIGTAAQSVAQATMPTADAVTEGGRSLAAAVDGFCSLPSGAKPGARTMMVVLDPTTSVAKMGLEKVFAASLARNSTDLVGAKLGLFVAGRGVLVSPTEDHEKVSSAMAEVLARPVDQAQNLFAAVREASAVLARGRGARQLLLVTLDNGDAEDDVEGTGQMLKRRAVTLRVVTPDACLADSYWLPGNQLRLGNLERPADVARGAKLVGGDAPIVDVPFGFLFQPYDANIVTPAGYAPYAWSRVAQLAGGGSRVVLHAGEANWTHHCTLYGECLDCGTYYFWHPEFGTRRELHKDHGEDYRDGRLQQMAPLLVSRKDAVGLLAKDPFARATMKAWRSAFESGVMSSCPTLRMQANAASLETQVADWSRDSLHLLIGEEPLNRPEPAIAKAKELAAKAAALEAELGREIAAAPIDPANLRQMAIARYTQVMLAMTRVALLEYEQFLRVECPKLLAKDRAEKRTGASLYWDELSICHGLGMHVRRLPEGHLARPAMARAATLFDSFLRDFGGSPFSFALKRMSLPRFELWYPGTVEAEVSPTPRLPGKEPARPTTPGRPGGGRSGPRTGR